MELSSLSIFTMIAIAEIEHVAYHKLDKKFDSDINEKGTPFHVIKVLVTC